MTSSRRRSSDDGADDVRAPGYHRPVLVDEVMRSLIGGRGLYLDGTVGGGGHALAFFERCAECRLVAFDRDPEALSASQSRLAAFADRPLLCGGHFREVAEDRHFARGPPPGRCCAWG